MEKRKCTYFGANATHHLYKHTAIAFGSPLQICFPLQLSLAECRSLGLHQQLSNSSKPMHQGHQLCFFLLSLLYYLTLQMMKEFSTSSLSGCPVKIRRRSPCQYQACLSRIFKAHFSPPHPNQQREFIIFLGFLVHRYSLALHLSLILPIVILSPIHSVLWQYFTRPTKPIELPLYYGFLERSLQYHVQTIAQFRAQFTTLLVVVHFPKLCGPAHS